MIFPKCPNKGSCFLVFYQNQSLSTLRFFPDKLALSLPVEKNVTISVCPLLVSLFLSLSFASYSLSGNILGIAPLLSSPLAGCCRRLSSVTTVCTQPGAPSNTTSLTRTPRGGPNATHACVCTQYTHLMLTSGLLQLLYLCLYTALLVDSFSFGIAESQHILG